MQIKVLREISGICEFPFVLLMKFIGKDSFAFSKTQLRLALNVISHFKKQMRTRTSLIFLTISVLLMSCGNRTSSKPEQSILLFKDKDGLYLYDPNAKKEKIVFKLEKDQIFLEEPCNFQHDTLIVGLKGERITGQNFTKDYYSLDTKSGKSWLSQQIMYEEYYKNEYMLLIKTISLDTSGKSTVISDTSMPWKATEGSWKGVVYNDIKPRFYSDQTVGDKTIFSSQGSIYLTENLDTILLLEYKGHFDPKFGSGYLQPQIDPTGEYAIYTYAPEFLNFFQSQSLRKIDLQSKETETLKSGEYGSPTFSSDGKFILFNRDFKENKLKVMSSDIYVLDVATLAEVKISNAYSAQWTKKNGL